MVSNCKTKGKKLSVCSIICLVLLLIAQISVIILCTESLKREWFQLYYEDGLIDYRRRQIGRADLDTITIKLHEYDAISIINIINLDLTKTWDWNEFSELLSQTCEALGTITGKDTKCGFDYVYKSFDFAKTVIKCIIALMAITGILSFAVGIFSRKCKKVYLPVFILNFLSIIVCGVLGIVALLRLNEEGKDLKEKLNPFVEDQVNIVGGEQSIISKFVELAGTHDVKITSGLVLLIIGVIMLIPTFILACVELIDTSRNNYWQEMESPSGAQGTEVMMSEIK